MEDNKSLFEFEMKRDKNIKADWAAPNLLSLNSQMTENGGQNAGDFPKGSS